MSKRDYYEILGVGRDATDQQIKSAYRKLALKYHTDRNPGDHKAEEAFKEAAEAYAIISDTDKRSAYDRFGHAGVSGAGDAGVAEAIVGRPLVGVRDDRVRLGRELELLLGGRVSGIAVRMVLERQLAIGALDGSVAGIPPDAEDLVVVPLAHPLATFTIAGRNSFSPSR